MRPKPLLFPSLTHRAPNLAPIQMQPQTMIQSTIKMVLVGMFADNTDSAVFVE